jgi:hypothetical protein
MALSAHDKSILLDKASGIKPINCSNICKYYKFEHRDRACVLSDVYFTEKGKLCYNYKLVNEK